MYKQRIIIIGKIDFKSNIIRSLGWSRLYVELYNKDYNKDGKINIDYIYNGNHNHSHNYRNKDNHNSRAAIYIIPIIRLSQVDMDNYNHINPNYIIKKYLLKAKELLVKDINELSLYYQPVNFEHKLFTMRIINTMIKSGDYSMMNKVSLKNL